jgi:gas vesicle protein
MEGQDMSMPKEAQTTMMIRSGKRGQSIAEYAVLFAVVIGAYVAMQVYAKRGMQARVKNATDALTDVKTDVAVAGLTARFNSQSQYEPYYLESSYKTYQESVKRQHMGSGKVVEEIASDLTARAAGGSQRQKGASGRGTADALWVEPAPPPSGGGSPPSGG